MTRDEKRCLRSVNDQLIQAQRDILFAALEDNISAQQRADVVDNIRRAADKLERGHD